ncbi:MAG TPA: hypothetical protein VIP82_20900 [Microbacterium sp.]|uniref:hypothetical protein n=1 Tax=Microbacterium sp. TaxID=51671 RepID=UPI002F91E639
MGYNIGAKGVAIGLLALTGGDRQEADRVWKEIRYGDPRDVAEALDMVEAAIAAKSEDTP